MYSSPLTGVGDDLRWLRKRKKGLPSPEPPEVPCHAASTNLLVMRPGWRDPEPPLGPLEACATGTGCSPVADEPHDISQRRWGWGLRNSCLGIWPKLLMKPIVALRFSGSSILAQTKLIVNNIADVLNNTTKKTTMLELQQNKNLIKNQSQWWIFLKIISN